MWHTKVLQFAVGAAVVAGISLSTQPSYAQQPYGPNDAPNLYKFNYGWAKLPDRRKFGAVVGVDIDRDGKSVWAFDRCESATDCSKSTLDPIMKFDETGKLVKSFGGGMINYSHGLHVDKDNNIWVSDGRALNNGKGHTVFKFDQNGKLLMTLGKPGVAGAGQDTFSEPSDILVAPNGDIFVADGHGAVAPDLPPDTITRIIKFTPDGKFLKAWGSLGSKPSQFRNPHALVFDSQGRLLVADRVNGRIQAFDQDGKYLTEYRQFNHPSGLFITKDDTLYATDYNSEGQKGTYIGSAKTGKVFAFVPDAQAGEGIALGADGVLYAATPGGVTRFLPNKKQ